MFLENIRTEDSRQFSKNPLLAVPLGQHQQHQNGNDTHPNPLMAPFFILFYGMMLADMGYGLIMMILSWIIMKKAKPNGATMRHMKPD